MTAASELRAARSRLLALPPKKVKAEVVKASHIEVPAKPPSSEELGVAHVSTGVQFDTRPGARGGSYGLAEYEYNPDLKGKAFFEEINRMRMSDSQVKAVTNMIKLPLLAADWRVEPASSSDIDRRIAVWYEDQIFNHMSRTWHYTLRHSLLSLDFGSMPMETVFVVEQDDDENRPMVKLKKLAPRFPSTILEWVVDEQGGLEEIVQETMKRGVWGEAHIEIARLLVFVHDMEGANWRGTSLLRQARKDWVIKERLQRINQVAIEKRASGVDVGTMDETASQEQKNRDAFESALMSIRTHERGYLMLPSGHEYKIAGIEGQVLDPLPSIKYADVMILRSILADFLTAGSGGEGSYNLVKDRTSFYLMALLGISKEVLEPINRYLLPKWVTWNFPNVEVFPTLQHSRLDRRDVAALATALGTLIPQGVITPDSDLEQELRDLLDLPRLATDETPPPPGTNGLPTLEDLVDTKKGPEAFRKYRALARMYPMHEIIKAHGDHDQSSHGVGGGGGGSSWKKGSSATSDNLKSAGLKKVSPSGSYGSAFIASDGALFETSTDQHATDLEKITGRTGIMSSIDEGDDQPMMKALKDTGLVRVAGHGAVHAAGRITPDQASTLGQMEKLAGRELDWDYGDVAEGGSGKSGTGVDSLIGYSNRINGSKSVKVVDFLMMGREIDSTEIAIAKAYEVVQKKQIAKVIDEAMKCIEKLDSNALEEVNVPYIKEAADAIVQPLIELYRLGQAEVKRETAKMGGNVLRMALPMDPTNDRATIAFLRARARMIARSLAERLRGSLMRNGMDLIREMSLREVKADSKETPRLTLEGRLQSLSGRVIRGEAKLSASEALNLGRDSVAKANELIVSKAEYSAIMDEGSCPECSELDGKEFIYGSSQYEQANPPYKECLGRGRCRCVMLFTFNSETPPHEKKPDIPSVPTAPKLSDLPSSATVFAKRLADPAYAEQLEALKFYQTTSYDMINTSLRTGKGIADYQAEVKRLDAATSMGHLAEDTRLWRGMVLTPERFEEIRRAGAFADDAFTSTSFDPGVADRFLSGKSGARVLIEIKAPSGTKGAFMEKLTKGELAREKEFLLPRGSKFTIQKIVDLGATESSSYSYRMEVTLGD